jgi:hypothetical protein
MRLSSVERSGALNGASNDGVSKIGCGGGELTGLIATGNRVGEYFFTKGIIAGAGGSTTCESISLARTISNPKARSARNAKRALALVRDDFALESATTLLTFALRARSVKFGAHRLARFRHLPRKRSMDIWSQKFLCPLPITAKRG